MPRPTAIPGLWRNPAYRAASHRAESIHRHRSGHLGARPDCGLPDIQAMRKTPCPEPYPLPHYVPCDAPQGKTSLSPGPGERRLRSEPLYRARLVSTHLTTGRNSLRSIRSSGHRQKSPRQPSIARAPLVGTPARDDEYPPERPGMQTPVLPRLLPSLAARPHW